MYTDFHAHVLPGMDHGSSNLQTSLSQIKCAIEHKVSTIVATSHFYPERHSVESFLEKRENSLELLSEVFDVTVSSRLINSGVEEVLAHDSPRIISGTEAKLSETTESLPRIIPGAEGTLTVDLLRIIPGAEVMLTYDLPSLQNLDKLCIAGTRYILIEMPEPGYTQTNWIFDALNKISSVNKLRPIIAHIDRYESGFANQLMGVGYTIQINADALMPHHKRKKWIRLIEQNRIHLLGSDVHGEGKEYKYFSRAVNILKRHTSILMRNAERVLHDQLL